MKARFIYNSRIAKWLDVNAITLYPFIFVSTSEAEPWLMRHELEHVKQVQKVGWFRFYGSYLLYYFAHRLAGYSEHEAYYWIPWEEEAREAEDKV